MGQRSPLVTLAATGVGLLALLVVDSTQAGGATPAADGTANAGPTSAPASQPSTPSSSPSTAQPSTTEPTATVTPSRATPAAQVVVYVGRTAGREATLAVAVKGGRAVAYVCDGRRVEAWLTGTFTNGQLALRSKTGDRLTGSATAKTAAGELTVRGRALRFTASLAGPPAGLYRARNSKSTIGWIILPDGSQVGIDNDGTPDAAPRLDPATRTATVNGQAVTAQPIAGDETLQ
ncbi:hypothetical protein AB0E69_06870 [Kribbella sp. NPDC026611]|uniref:hypothetical protein n=1 Tax=Kribbella sp. NPDC026611 TaxID=3154911 RepID=UPI0033C2F362